MTEQELHEIKMFSCTIQRINELVTETIDHKFNVDALGETKGWMQSALMFAMGCLSDAQHLQEIGVYEQSRQMMNVAKYLMGEVRTKLKEDSNAQVQ